MPVVQRLLATLFTLWLAATLAFFALRMLPGDAIAAQLTESGASRAVIDERRALLGLTEPLPAQYVHFIAGLIHGDLTRSDCLLVPQAKDARAPTLESILVRRVVEQNGWRNGIHDLFRFRKQFARWHICEIAQPGPNGWRVSGE